MLAMRRKNGKPLDDAPIMTTSVNRSDQRNATTGKWHTKKESALALGENNQKGALIKNASIIRQIAQKLQRY